VFKELKFTIINNPNKITILDIKSIGIRLEILIEEYQQGVDKDAAAVTKINLTQ